MGFGQLGPLTSYERKSIIKLQWAYSMGNCYDFTSMPTIFGHTLLFLDEPLMSQ